MKELKIHPVLKKLTIANTNGYNTSQNGETPAPIHYYEIPTSRKEESRPSIEDTSGLLN
jgi:hypothetical protein